MDWTVRLGRESDAEAVGRILASAYPTLSAPGVDAASLAKIVAAVRRPPVHLLVSGRYFVAERKDELLACGGWSPVPPPGVAARPGVGHLRHFATHSGWAGRGVGRSLFEASLAQCSGEGISRLDVVSTLGAEPFYRTLGFETLGPIAVPFGAV